MPRQPNHYEPPIVVALDIGSSSIRAMLIDRHGNMVEDAHVESEHRVQTTRDGGAVLDPDEVVRDTITCLTGLRETKKFKQWRKYLAAVSCSMFMHTLVGTDRAGRVLTPLYMWSDTRSREALTRRSGKLDAGRIHQSTGCPLHTSYPLAKLLWLRDAQRSLFRRVHHWLSMGDYLHLQLFGRPTLSYSMASGTGLLSRQTLRWDGGVLALAGVRAGQLGELVDFNERNAGVDGKFAGELGKFSALPWFPAMGDGICSNIGSGCVDESLFALNLGTSGAMRAMFRNKAGRVPDGLFCYVVDRRRVLLGGAISNCGNLRRWLLDTMQLGKRADMERALSRMKPDSHGLTVLPFLAGERAPFWPNDVTGAIFGLRSATKPIDLARAGFDAVCYQLALIHDRLGSVLPRARKIVVSGGGSSSDWWMQMMADTYDMPVQLSRVAEASSRGAALLALEALAVVRGVESVQAALGRTFEPNRQRGEMYRTAARRYLEFCNQWSTPCYDLSKT